MQKNASFVCKDLNVYFLRLIKIFSPLKIGSFNNIFPTKRIHFFKIFCSVEYR